MPTAKRKSAETSRRELGERVADVRRRVAEGHARYHRALADPTIDTAAKRIARRSGLDWVRCPCGEEFPSGVRRK